MKRNEVVAALAMVALMAASGNAYATTVGLTCTNTSSDHLGTALTGGSAWTVGGTHAVVAGDIVQLTGFCQGDAAVKTSGIELDNHNSQSTINGSDGINGQLTISGAANVTIKGLEFKAGVSGDSFARPNESANVVESAAAVTFIGDVIIEGPLIGLYLAGTSNAQFTGGDIEANGTANIAGFNDGIRAEEGSTVNLVNTFVQSNMGNGVTLFAGSNLETANTSIQNNGDCTTQCGSQLYVSGASMARLQGSTVNSPDATSTAQPPLVVAVGASSLFIESGSTLGFDEASDSAALLVAGASSVVLNSSNVQTTGVTQPVIEASASSSIILAGGNNVSTIGSGTVIEIDHSSSLLHQQAVMMGYAADAAESITGNGRILMQSSLELGQGPVSGAFGIVWTGTIAVGQNSAFRTQGGTHITGAVQISAASNGYINCNNVSGGALNSTCGGAAGAANQIDGTIQCLELLSTSSNPNVHVSNPQGVTRDSGGDPGTTAANLFGASSFSNTSEPANTCLNF